MQKYIFVAGNPLVKSDNLPIKLLPKLRRKFPRVNFVHFDPTEELPQFLGRDLIIIDTVLGIKKVKKFNDLNHWTVSPRVTVHDYDLPLTFGILKKLGKLKNIIIIGIPPKGHQKEILEEVEKILITSGI